MSDFLIHKEKFLRFLDNISEEDKHVGIVSHANCVDGLASAVFMAEILKKEKPFIKIDISFITYTSGILDNLSEKFENLGIKKVFVLDVNADASLYEEFEKFRDEFEVCFIDHHPINPNFKIKEGDIKTPSYDCTALTLFRFGEDIIDYNEWSWLACVASISEFSYKNEDNLNFIQSYYPDFNLNNVEFCEIFKMVTKINSLVTYYSKNSLEAYEVLINRDFEKMDKISRGISLELDRCLNDFEKNSENYFDGHLLFYFFKSKFSLSSTLSTIMSVRHKGSTIIIISEIEKTNMLKVSARNNGENLTYPMNEMLRAGINGLNNALAGGHNPASGGSFLAKDIGKFKEQILNFVKYKVN